MEYESQIATTTELAQAIASDALTTLSVVIAVVLGIAVFSASVAFAWRKLQKYALGRKF